ncbi:MAG: serine hydrolase domain-containing protein [Nitrospinota bacterium]
MISKKKDEEFSAWVHESIYQASEGIVGAAYHKGQKVLEFDVGKTYPYYEIASLTKIIFTTTAFIQAVEKNKIKLDDPIGNWLEWYSKPDTNVASFLTHTSGLAPWKPYYTELMKREEGHDRVSLLQTLLTREPVQWRERAQYSDLGFMVLGFLLERIWNCSLEDIWSSLDLGLENTVFHVQNLPRTDRKNYAPTENCTWRSMIIQGEVHDDNAWALGGVAAHSGLFSNISDLSKWFLALRAGLLGKTSKLGSSEIVQEFTKRSFPPSIGDWATSFMLPTEGRASCGKYFSPDSIGHTGFTGTSAWLERKKDLLIVLLANRTYPDRNNTKFIHIRPLIHDKIVEILDLQS